MSNTNIPLRYHYTGSTDDGFAEYATGDVVTFPCPIDTIASVTGTAGINVPHGTAPTSPVNGDVWTTTAGLFARINGVTVGPYVSAASSLFSTQNVVTGSRALGTVYHNTTGKTMFINVASYNNTTNEGFFIVSDSSSSPSTIVSITTDPIANSAITLSCIVLPNNYYEAYWNAGVGTLYAWTEWY